ncbi:cupin domain-containing protein [Pedobacter jamesrossensis]|uniref:AraC-type arabinose-binding/dimerisation domain-containing protein n=1 Tax=Pedobacter jamesrossensis TaxID=1908238 RepID=A0ABV8NK35_9SPHI
MTLEKAETKNHLNAIRLINTENNDCAFEIGKIPIRQHINTNYFFAQTDISLQKAPHSAPRRQYVITLKGKLKFEVTNGDTFFIEPGIILIADDTEGIGHTWEIVDGDEWERIYIPLEENAEDYFIAD